MTLREQIERYIVDQHPICSPSAVKEVVNFGITYALSMGFNRIDWDGPALHDRKKVNSHYLHYFAKTVETVLGDFAYAPVRVVSHADLACKGSPGILSKMMLSVARLYVDYTDLGYQCVDPKTGKISMEYLSVALNGIKALTGSQEGNVVIAPYKDKESYMVMDYNHQPVYAVTVIIETGYLEKFFFRVDTSNIFEHLPTVLSRLGVLHQFDKMIPAFEPCEL